MLKKRVSLKTLMIAAWLVYLATLIPMLWIGIYDYPAADDFSESYAAYQAFQNGGVLSAIAAAARMSAWYYFNWMGYFTSNFFTSLPPSVFGETAYAATVWIILGVLTFSVAYFLHAFLVKMLGADRYAVGSAAAVILFLMVQCMPRGMARVEAFYWYCGAAGYVITFSLMLIFLGLLISFLFDRRKKKRIYDYILAVLLSFFIGGGNYLSGLVCAILMVLLIVGIFLSFAVGRKREGAEKFESSDAVWEENETKMHLKWLFLPAILMLVGFAANCFAPGNRVRASGLSGYSPLKAILISLHYTLEYCCSEWTNWAVICLLIMLIPVFWNCFHHTDNHFLNGFAPSFRYPVLVVLFGFGLVSASICPSLAAMGNISSGRFQATFWMLYVLILVLVEWYLVGWARTVLEKKKNARDLFHMNPVTKKGGSSVSVQPENSNDQLERALDKISERVTKQKKKIKDETSPGLGVTSTRMVLFLLLFFIAGSALSVKAEPGEYTFTLAIQELRDGSAKAYGEENAARRSILRDGSQKDVQLESYSHEPELLFFSDIDENADGWQNQAIARYYHKDSVTRTPNKKLD